MSIEETKDEEVGEEIKKTGACWHTPVLGAECPHCGEWNDYTEQWRDHDYPFQACTNDTTSEDLAGMEWECPDCKKTFEFSEVTN